MRVPHSPLLMTKRLLTPLSLSLSLPHAHWAFRSAKAPLLEQIEGEELEIKVERRLEIQNGTEFTHENFYSTLHPVEQVHALKFARPKGPGGRKGTRRMTRPSRGSSGGSDGAAP